MLEFMPLQDIVDLAIAIVLLVFVIWISRRTRTPVRFARPSLIDAAISASVGAGLFFVMALALGLNISTGGYGARPLQSINLVLITPLAEEIIFRGAAIEFVLARRVNICLAIVTSAAVFALIHLHHSFLDYLLLFLGGVVLSILYMWRRNIALPFAAHAVLNGLVILGGGK